MRARSREVNIFNMSLLDILCGALGAFCFMMLVLLPYYKPPGAMKDLSQQEQDVNDLVKKIQDLQSKVPDADLARQLQDTVSQLQQQIQSLQGQVNQLTADKQDLSSQRDKLQSTNDQQAQTIAMRNPITAISIVSPPQEVALYIQGDAGSASKLHQGNFNPADPHGGIYWEGDRDMWNGSLGFSMWTVRDTPANFQYRVYVSLTGTTSARQAATVDTNIMTEGIVDSLPEVQLTPAHYWEYLGSFKTLDDYKISFTEATAAERSAEWARLMKNVPSSFLPAPSANTSGAAGGGQSTSTLVHPHP